MKAYRRDRVMAKADSAHESTPFTEGELTELREQLLRSVRRICHGRLAQEAEDFVQSAFISAAKANPEFEGDRSRTVAYLKKAAFSAFMDEVRRWLRRREVQPQDGLDALVTPSTGEGFERSVAIGQGIGECLAGLSASRRLAVTLWLQGHSAPEVARLLRWSVRRADNLIYRGRTDLRACLAGKGLEP